jgi:hypothetical protein
LNTQTNIEESNLIHTQKELEQIYQYGYPLMDIEGERLFFLDTVQRVFTKGGIGGGHLILRELTLLLESGIDADEILYHTGFGLTHARRDETIRKANEFYDQLIEISKITPYQAHKRNLRASDRTRNLSHRYFFVRMLMPALDRVCALTFEGKATHEATLAVLALRRWQLEKGTYPESLESLVVEGYLQELPDDPYSDGILRYEKRDDNFILYSLGRNFVDDGGVQHPEANFQWGDIEKVGDRVFRPIE